MGRKEDRRITGHGEGRTVRGAPAAATRSLWRAVAAPALLACLLLGGYAVGCSTTDKGKEPSRNSAAGELALDLGNNVTMKLVIIPAGKFMMGSPPDEAGRYSAEGPQREVTISKPFYMGIHEVTQQQYEAVSGRNPSRFQGKACPVEMVSWDEAVAFCQAVSKKTGKKVRLPTEAEWEYACRAGSTSRFSFGDGDADLGNYAWFTGNSNSQTHPVGQKKPNAWGLYDMHGNVWEWCADWHADSYAGAGNVDPVGPGSGTSRVLRGGSWYVNPQVCRSAFRNWIYPDARSVDIGFRVVAALD